jgi:glucose/arabinose dehydrogenase
MKAIAITVLALCGLLATCVPAYADPAYPAGFDETALATGLTAPTMVDWAPDGRMFVAEKGGVLKVVPAGSDTARTVVDLSDRVNSAWDRGLLGLALDADFARTVTSTSCTAARSVRLLRTATRPRCRG